MRPLTMLQERFAFTRNEIVVMLFLASTLCAGILLRAFHPVSSEAPRIPGSASAQSDSIFAARSAAAPADVRPTGQRPGRNSAAKSAPAPASVNINTASAAQLAKLPGIGPAIAQRIIEYREEHGLFVNAGDLRHVKGIGQKKFEAMAPFIAQ